MGAPSDPPAQAFEGLVAVNATTRCPAYTREPRVVRGSLANPAQMPRRFEGNARSGAPQTSSPYHHIMRAGGPAAVDPTGAAHSRQRGLLHSWIGGWRAISVFAAAPGEAPFRTRASPGRSGAPALRRSASRDSLPSLGGRRFGVRRRVWIPWRSRLAPINLVLGMGPGRRRTQRLTEPRWSPSSSPARPASDGTQGHLPALSRRASHGTALRAPTLRSSWADIPRPRSRRKFREVDEWWQRARRASHLATAGGLANKSASTRR